MLGCARPKRAAPRRSRRSAAACKGHGSTTRAPRPWTPPCSAKTSRPREPSTMSELREFVADLLERQGAAIGALGPDGLEVLAPAFLQKQLGWPELAHLGFGTERAHGTIAIALEGDWLDRFGALLADEGRWSEREVRPRAAVPPPSDPERVLDRVLDLPNAVWRFPGTSPTSARCLVLAVRLPPG